LREVQPVPTADDKEHPMNGDPTHTVWAYDGPDGTDPHALVVTFPEAEAHRLPPRGLESVGVVVIAADVTGRLWQAQIADCGSDRCFCAMRLTPVQLPTLTPEQIQGMAEMPRERVGDYLRRLHQDEADGREWSPAEAAELQAKVDAAEAAERADVALEGTA
jgi:hypothetical protein